MSSRVALRICRSMLRQSSHRGQGFVCQPFSGRDECFGSDCNAFGPGLQEQVFVVPRGEGLQFSKGQPFRVSSQVAMIFLCAAENGRWARWALVIQQESVQRSDCDARSIRGLVLGGIRTRKAEVSNRCLVMECFTSIKGWIFSPLIPLHS